MLLGYLVVRTLLGLVHAMSRAPRWLAKSFAATLNAVARPFHVINYAGSCAGALVFNHERMGRRLDRTIAALHRHLDAESEATLARGGYFPPGWDPFFQSHITLAQVYHYATQHFDFHRRQLTLEKQ